MKAIRASSDHPCLVVEPFEWSVAQTGAGVRDDAVAEALDRPRQLHERLQATAARPGPPVIERLPSDVRLPTAEDRREALLEQVGPVDLPVELLEA